MNKTNCNHEGLVDTGVGYYHCPICDKGWTCDEWESYASQFQSGEQLYRFVKASEIISVLETMFSIYKKYANDNPEEDHYAEHAEDLINRMKSLPSPQLAGHKEEAYTREDVIEILRFALFGSTPELYDKGGIHGNHRLAKDHTNKRAEKVFSDYKQSLLSKEQNPETDK